jgi:RNA polymerase sigma-70 factor, ECF subfamily
VNSTVAESDAALVMAAVAGDRAAFGLLLSRQRPALVRLCLRLTGEPATAEDCAQDACLLAYLRLDRLRSPESFGAWLNGIGRHTCYHVVEARRQGSTPLTDVLELAVSETESAVTAVTRSELSRDLRTAVGELPAAQREAVRVFYLDGLSHAEAADALGIGLSALKVRLHDARRTLKHRYRLDDAAAPAIAQRNPRTLAFHEAGHAVLLWSHDAPVQRVSIEPISAVRVGEPAESREPFQLPVTIRLQMHMAGEAATFVQGRWSASLEQSGDRVAAAALARQTTGGDKRETALFVHAAWLQACELLNNERTWRRVERVATALLTRHAIDGDDVRRLCHATP